VGVHGFALQVGESQLPKVQVAAPEAVYPLSHENTYDAPLAVFAPPLTPFVVVKSEAHGSAVATTTV